MLIARQKELQEKRRQFEAKIAELGGDALKQLDMRIAAANKTDVHPLSAQFGYHSLINQTADSHKWVQVDLGDVQSLATIQLVGCHDDFNHIGAGFGFPVRFKVELCDNEDFEEQTTLITDFTDKDFPNPGVKPQKFPTVGKSGRFVRVTATKLALRQNDYIFALAELSAIDDSGKNVALGRPVRGIDSIEAPVRWRQSNLVDGYFYGIAAHDQNSLAELKHERDELLAKVVDPVTRAAMDEVFQSLAGVTESLSKLPPPKRVYAGMIHTGGGAFSGTGPFGGKPRVIRILGRGDVTNPATVVGPGAVRLGPAESGEFGLPAEHGEGQRRVALAQWITAKENPLTWRSIVNRIWLYHFGRGIVDSPNDFGRMGQRPSHPELLDWLAVEFRDNGQSLKQLHRMIVTSATYRQKSNGDDNSGSVETQSRPSRSIPATSISGG